MKRSTLARARALLSQLPICGYIRRLESLKLEVEHAAELLKVLREDIAQKCSYLLDLKASITSLEERRRELEEEIARLKDKRQQMENYCSELAYAFRKLAEAVEPAWYEFCVVPEKEGTTHLKYRLYAIWNLWLRGYKRVVFERRPIPLEFLHDSVYSLNELTELRICGPIFDVIGYKESISKAASARDLYFVQCGLLTERWNWSKIVDAMEDVRNALAKRREIEYAFRYAWVISRDELKRCLPVPEKVELWCPPKALIKLLG